MKVYDVAVVGLGAMGSSALYHAAKRGLSVIGIEQFHDVPHQNGSHHGSTRIIRKAYFEDPGYVPLLLRAYELWEELERVTGQTLLVKSGGLMIGTAESEVLSGAIRAAKEHRLPYEYLTREEVRRYMPALHLDPNQAAVLEPDAGYLLSEVAVRAQIEQAVHHGAEVRLGMKINEWHSTSNGVMVRMADEVVYANRLILTVGAWASSLLNGVPLEVERQVLFWFDSKDSTLSESPIYVVEEDDGLQFYGFPTLASEGTKVAFHHGGSICTPETVDRLVTPEEVERMREFLKRRIPVLGYGKLLKTSTCMYTNTPDFHFVVGAHPSEHHVILGLGYSGHGFKFASVMGEILVGMAQGESTMKVPNILSPNRHAIQGRTTP